MEIGTASSTRKGPFGIPMQSFYDRVSGELLQAIEKYMNDEMELEDVLVVQEKEVLLTEYEKWPEYKKYLRGRVFELTRKLFSDVCEVEQYVRTFQKLDESKEVECDSDALISHSFILGRNRAPPPGFEHSNWYLGPYPTMQMIEVLREEEDNKEN